LAVSSGQTSVSQPPTCKGRSQLQGTSRRALALSPARAPGRPGRVPRSILCAQNAAVQHAPAMRQHRDARALAQTSSARKLHMLRHHGLSVPCGEAHGLLKDECGLAVRHLRLALLLLLLSSEAALPSQQAIPRPTDAASEHRDSVQRDYGVCMRRLEHDHRDAMCKSA
jgi:hypothetical protein